MKRRLKRFKGYMVISRFKHVTTGKPTIIGQAVDGWEAEDAAASPDTIAIIPVDLPYQLGDGMQE